jgi:hypothetical protein
MSIQTNNWQTVWNNRGLVYGAVKRAGISRDDRDYEDLIQAGLILYAEMLAKSNSQLNHGLIFQAVKWRSLDYVRRRNYRPEGINERGRHLSPADYLTIEAMLPSFSQLELLIFQEHLLAGVNLRQLVTISGVSYRTLKRTKSNICRRFRSSLT